MPLAHPAPGPDDRGQSIGIGLFFLSLIVGAIVFGVMFTPIYDTVYDEAQNQTSNQTALDGMEWSRSIWTNWPVYIVGISAMGLIVWSVFTGAVG